MSEDRKLKYLYLSLYGADRRLMKCEFKRLSFWVKYGYFDSELEDLYNENKYIVEQIRGYILDHIGGRT